MSASDHGSSLSDLLGGLVQDISGLFRKEIELASAEAGEKIDQVVGASRNLAIGAVLAIGATGVLLTALVAGVAAVLVAMGLGETVANFLGALIVALVIGGISWALIQRGLNDVRTSHLKMKRTAHSLRADAKVVEESLS